MSPSLLVAETESVLESFGTDTVHGLTNEQVRKSRELHGANVFSPPDKDPLWKQYLEKFKDPTIIILCVCAVITVAIGIYKEDFPWEGLAIIVAVAIATGVGFWSEYKADQAFELLKKDTANISVKVVRNGEFHTIGISDLVVGDLVHLEGGDKIPADCLLVEGIDLTSDESMFTGETLPARKDANNANLIGGAVIVEGNGKAIVTAVGDKMEKGQILKALGETDEEETPLQEKLHTMADFISTAGTAAAVLIFLALLGAAVFMDKLAPIPADTKILLAEFIGVVVVVSGVLLALKRAQLRRIVSIGSPALIIVALLAITVIVGKPQDPILSLKVILEYFIVAVTIVVVAVPEGLPLAVTISLALSMRKIRQDNNLVRKMVATETIGSATVICSDKTGTLTKNQMAVQAIYLHGQMHTGDEVEHMKSHPALELLAFASAVNSTAHLERQDGLLKFVGNPTEGALLAWLDRQGINYLDIREKAPIRSRVCFSADRKMMTTMAERNSCESCAFCRLDCLGSELTSTTAKHDGCWLVLTKGAPERVLPLCTTIESNDGSIKPIEVVRSNMDRQIESLTNQAMRPLALAYRPVNKSQNAFATGETEGDTESDLTLLALIGISDPVREDAFDAVRACKAAGIEVKMVTGDHLKTATAIAESIGLLDSNSLVMEGEAFRAMPDNLVKEILGRLRVLARSKPLDKERLVTLLQEQDEVVAVTGDGTNDAPALKKADVGISMGLKGTDVAKEASDIVLTDDNFGSIVRAVHWGRALYENVQKFLQFQLTINVSALAIAFLSPILSLLFPSLNFSALPLTVLQLLWINLIMDTLAALALGLEPPRPEIMKEQPKHRSESFVTPAMRNNILVMAVYFTIVLLLIQATDFLGAKQLGDPRAFASVLFTTFVFLQVFNEFNARSVHPQRSVFAGLFKSRWFLGILAFIVIVQVGMTQFGGEIFNTAPLPLDMWIKIIVLAGTTLIVGEGLRWVQRLFDKRERPLPQPALARG